MLLLSEMEPVVSKFSDFDVLAARIWQWKGSNRWRLVGNAICFSQGEVTIGRTRRGNGIYLFQTSQL
jgi:hypothetical protein